MSNYMKVGNSPTSRSFSWAGVGAASAGISAAKGIEMDSSGQISKKTVSFSP
jgi:hypothetical protein